MESHLLQMRGLKQGETDLVEKAKGVASFTDAWIETCLFHIHLLPLMSHLLQMRGLKLTINISHDIYDRRIFYRCVD